MAHNGFFAKGIHKMMDFYNIFRTVDWRVSSADAPHVRIYLLHSGSATLPLTDGLLSMQAGHAYLLPAHLLLSEARGTDAVYDVIRFVPNVLTEHLLPLAGCAREIPLSPTIAPLAEACISPCDTAGARLRAESAIGLLLAAFLETASPDLLAPDRDLGRFLPVFSHIDAHISDTLTLEELAAQADTGKVYFSNLFKKTFSVSPQQYVGQRRANASCRLLACTDRSVTEIADALGFYDPAAFTAFIKKNVGMTPKAYREWAVGLQNAGKA